MGCRWQEVQRPLSISPEEDQVRPNHAQLTFMNISQTQAAPTTRSAQSYQRMKCWATLSREQQGCLQSTSQRPVDGDASAHEKEEREPGQRVADQEVDAEIVLVRREDTIDAAKANVRNASAGRTASRCQTRQATQPQVRICYRRLGVHEQTGQATAQAHPVCGARIAKY